MIRLLIVGIEDRLDTLTQVTTELGKQLHRLTVTTQRPVKHLRPGQTHRPGEKLSGAIVLVDAVQIGNHAELAGAAVPAGIQLVVDDDSTILDLYKRILKPGTPLPELPPFEVTCCTQGDEAVDSIRHSLEENISYAVVFLDLNMPPGPDGQWAAEEIHKLDPAINIVMVTGYRSTNVGNVVHRPDFSKNLLYLQKPFHPAEIIQFAIH